MYIGKVIGNVVSTTKSELLTGLKLLLIQQMDMLTMKPVGTPVVIADTVGAGVGEVVMVVTGGSARLTEQTTGKPVDASIIGIIDTIEMEGAMLFQKYPPKPEAAQSNTDEEQKAVVEQEAVPEPQTVIEIDSNEEVKVVVQEEPVETENKAEEQYSDVEEPIIPTEPQEIPQTEKQEPKVQAQEPKAAKAPSPESKKQLLEKVTKKKKRH